MILAGVVALNFNLRPPQAMGSDGADANEKESASDIKSRLLILFISLLLRRMYASLYEERLIFLLVVLPAHQERRPRGLFRRNQKNGAIGMKALGVVTRNLICVLKTKTWCPVSVAIGLNEVVTDTGVDGGQWCGSVEVRSWQVVSWWLAYYLDLSIAVREKSCSR